MTSRVSADAPVPAIKLRHPTFAEAFRFWLKLGFISFGGPAGQIAIMQTELVERKKWISQQRFLHALNYCMLLPGPEAQQLATYVGWLLHKTRGGIAAGALFVIPSMLVLWALSFVYVRFGTVPWIAAVFYGLKPAVLAIVVAAVIRIGRKALKNWSMWALAGIAFVAIYFLKLPFPAIMLGAALAGFIGSRVFHPGRSEAEQNAVEGSRGPDSKPTSQDPSTALRSVPDDREMVVLGDHGETPEHAKPSLARAIRVCVVCLGLWWLPVLAIGLWLGWNHTIFREGIFFGKAAMVTFGGAYAVLPYVSQQAVESHHWLEAGQMLDGLGLAETTPGPLIMVLQFAGFLGAWNHPGNLPPLLAATLGAFITTWTTFVPCFLWIFLGAPHIEQLRSNERLGATLSAVTAAVVGVILNLAVWFGLRVFFPATGGFDWFALAVSLIAFAGLLRCKWNVIAVVVIGGILGIIGSAFHR